PTKSIIAWLLPGSHLAAQRGFLCSGARRISAPFFPGCANSCSLAWSFAPLWPVRRLAAPALLLLLPHWPPSRPRPRQRQHTPLHRLLLPFPPPPRRPHSTSVSTPILLI